MDRAPSEQAIPLHSRSNRYLNLFTWIAILSLAAIIANRLAIWSDLHKFGTKHANPHSPELIPESDLTIQEGIYDGEVREHRFRMHNPFDETLYIDHFVQSCDCLGIFPEANFVIPPKQERWFKVRFAPKTNSQTYELWENQTVQIGFSASYRIGDSQPKSSNWQLSAKLIPSLVIRPSIIEVGEKSRYEPNIDKVLSVEFNKEFTSIEVKTPPGWEADVVKKQSLARQKLQEVRLRYVGTREPTSLAADVEMFPVNGDGSKLSPKRLVVRGEISQDVVAVPVSLFFGRRSVGEQLNETITFRSRTGKMFEVICKTPRGGSLQISPTKDDSRSFSIRLNVSSIGEQYIPLLFQIQEADGVVYQIEVPVRYQGI